MKIFLIISSLILDIIRKAYIMRGTRAAIVLLDTSKGEDMLNLEFLQDVNSATSIDDKVAFITSEAFQMIEGGEIVAGSTNLLQKKAVDDLLECILQKLHEILESGFVTDKQVISDLDSVYAAVSEVASDEKMVNMVVDSLNDSLEIRADDY